jgi:hypothetical protein
VLYNNAEDTLSKALPCKNGVGINIKKRKNVKTVNTVLKWAGYSESSLPNYEAHCASILFHDEEWKESLLWGLTSTGFGGDPREALRSAIEGAWDCQVNPLPALRKRLGKVGYSIESRHFAKEDLSSYYSEEGSLIEPADEIIIEAGLALVVIKKEDK